MGICYLTINNHQTQALLHSEPSSTNSPSQFPVFASYRVSPLNVRMAWVISLFACRLLIALRIQLNATSNLTSESDHKYSRLTSHNTRIPGRIKLRSKITTYSLFSTQKDSNRHHFYLTFAATIPNNMASRAFLQVGWWEAPLTLRQRRFFVLVRDTNIWILT